jgi:hypothetical protein
MSTLQGEVQLQPEQRQVGVGGDHGSRSPVGGNPLAPPRLFLTGNKRGGNTAFVKTLAVKHERIFYFCS